MALAHELQSELLQMDLDGLISREEASGFPVQTRDANTPVSHLSQSAEAYRLAALLQLHLTFNDLSEASQLSWPGQGNSGAYQAALSEAANELLVIGQATHGHS